MPARLAALATAAACECAQLPAQAETHSDAPRSTVWSDGGCLHPTDPLLARAAWLFRCEALEQCNWAGPVQGKQTAQRAEVTAALAASRLIGGPIDLASDSQYVVKACARIVAGADVREWEHADLWEQLAPALRCGRLTARWIPAHKSAVEARLLGLAERDRLGNAAADSAAGEAARRRLPPRGMVQDRLAELARLDAAQRVMAAAHLAAVHATASVTVAPLHRRRDWARVRRGARARAGSAPAVPGRRRARGAVSSAAPLPASAAPRRGVDLVAFFAGGSWLPHCAAQGPRQAVCMRCGSSADSWANLSSTPCRGWSETLPARAQGLLLFSSPLRAGGSAEDFCTLIGKRLGQLPAAPD